MKETSKNIYDELQYVLDRHAFASEWKNIAFNLPSKKMDGLCLRASFAATIWHYIVEQAKIENTLLFKQFRETLFTRKIPFLAEMVISIQYLENQILDGKGGLMQNGILNRDKANINLIASHALKDLLYEYVEEDMGLENIADIRQVRGYLRRMFQYTDKGQFLEKIYASFENWHSGFEQQPKIDQETEAFIDYELIDWYENMIMTLQIPEEKRSYMRFYLRRIYLANASHFVLISDLICKLTGYNGPEHANLIRFAGFFGILGQLVNDVCDFLPASHGQGTVAKVPEDAFSDLKNGNITLPVAVYQSKCNINLDFDFNKYEVQKNIYINILPILNEIIIPFLQELSKYGKKSLFPGNCKSKKLNDFTHVVYNTRFFNPMAKDFKTTFC